MLRFCVTFIVAALSIADARAMVMTRAPAPGPSALPVSIPAAQFSTARRDPDQLAIRVAASLGLDGTRTVASTRIPEPASLALIGIGLVGLAATSRRRRVSRRC